MNAPVALTPELLTLLTAIVGENRIKTDADSLENWGRDHTKHDWINNRHCIFQLLIQSCLYVFYRDKKLNHQSLDNSYSRNLNSKNSSLSPLKKYI